MRIVPLIGLVLFLALTVADKAACANAAKDCSSIDNSGDMDRKIEACNHVIKQGGSDKYLAKAYNSRGYGYLYSDQFDFAALDFMRAMKLDPGFWKPYSNLCWAYVRKKIYNRAIMSCNRGISLKPEQVDLYYKRGMAYLWSKNIGRAILDFSRCIEINPNDAHCYHERGIAYHFLNAKERALADFDRASQIAPEWELPKRAREQLILGRAPRKAI